VATDQAASIIADMIPLLITLAVVAMIIGLMSGMTRGMNPAPKKEKPKRGTAHKDLDRAIADLEGRGMSRPEQRSLRDAAPRPVERKAKRVTCAACGERVKVPKPSQWAAESDTARCPHCGTSYHPYALGASI